MDNSLKREEDLATRRPKDDIQAKSLFPGQLDAAKLDKTKLNAQKREKASYKSPKTPRASSNPMWDDNLTDEGIYNAVTTLVKQWPQTEEQALNNRHDGDPAIRLLSVTTHAVTSAGKNTRRDYAGPCGWALAEAHIFPTYRPRILQGPSGQVRRLLKTALERFVRPWKTIKSARQVVTNKYFQFWDGLTLDNVITTATANQMDSAALQVDSARLRAQQNDSKEIQRLVTLLEHSYLSRPFNGPHKVICENISENITSLIAVSH